MKRMNKMLLVAALAATTLSVQAEQKKGPAWLSDALFYHGCFIQFTQIVYTTFHGLP